MGWGHDLLTSDHSTVPAVDFPWNEIADSLDGITAPAHDDSGLARALRGVLEWVDRGRSNHAKLTRLKAALHFATDRNQRDLAGEAHVTKAAIGKYVNQFRDEFGIKTRKMRPQETRERLAKIVRGRNAK